MYFICYVFLEIIYLESHLSVNILYNNQIFFLKMSLWNMVSIAAIAMYILWASNSIWTIISRTNVH